MKIIIFAGGLGNQMFQYAFFYANRKKYRDLKATTFWYNANKSHNGFELDKVFNISKEGFIFSKNKAKKEKILPENEKKAAISNNSKEYTEKKQKELQNVSNSKLTKIIRYILNNNPFLTFKEFGDSKYFENIFDKKGLMILSGYWQNQRYFIEEKDEICKIFQFIPLENTENDEKNRQIIEKINAENSVSIHVRRGDYVSNSWFDGVVTTEYYQKSVDFIKTKVQNPQFFVFSDDLGWCKAELKLPDNAVFVDWNSGKNSFRDMQLMSLCRHNIITNSSFSWWGAWLNRNAEKIVVRPKKWISESSGLDFSEICPEEWVAL